MSWSVTPFSLYFSFMLKFYADFVHTWNIWDLLHTLLLYRRLIKVEFLCDLPVKNTLVLFFWYLGDHPWRAKKVFNKMLATGFYSMDYKHSSIVVLWGFFGCVVWFTREKYSCAPFLTIGRSVECQESVQQNACNKMWFYGLQLFKYYCCVVRIIGMCCDGFKDEMLSQYDV